METNSSKYTDSEKKWVRLYARKQDAEVVRAVQFFRERGFEPVLIKGWAAALNYPSDAARFYSDVDLAFSAEDIDNARLIFRDEAKGTINADLHRELRHLDTRPWKDVFADSLLVDLHGTPIRIPSYEDHLRILAVHWLLDGGANRNKLWDVHYAVENRPANFSWEKCLNAVNKARKSWVIATIGLAHRYLGLEIDSLPFADEAMDLPDWLIKTVEREWNEYTPLKPLHSSLSSPRNFWKQFRKRFPPNPIRSMIEMEGDINAGTRIHYQMGSLAARAIPSFKGFARMLSRKI